ncbi:MAG TPA: hypothetical protein VHN18_05920 [Micromonosporaceae bacterium]|nr:hypothetical protein [Micromonosporaceae bacterium]
MRGSEPGSARQEAERLVATAVAAAQVAAGAAAARFGDPACCVCPVCRALAAVRDPDPAVVERLATRAGDVAAGVANLMRSASAARQGAAPGPDDEVWRVATQGRHTGRPGQPADDVWSAATRTTAGQAGQASDPA